MKEAWEKGGRSMAFEAVDALLMEAVGRQDPPSAAFAAGCGSRVYHRAFFGKTKLEGGVDVNADTLYDLASVTKVMATTMVALLLMEEGRLTLDDTLPAYFEHVPEDKAGITVRQLMTHTAGLHPSLPLRDMCGTPSDIPHAILHAPLVCPPGAQTHYSCMGFILLQHVLEKLTGERLDRLAKKRVFDPLGMTRTGFCPPPDENTAATEIDPVTGRPFQGVVHDGNARFAGGVSGNAGVFSSLTDCEKFVMMLAQGGGGLLAPGTLERAVRCLTPGMESSRGLGFHLGGRPGNFCGDLFPDDSFGHTGFTGTSFTVDPSTGIFTILLTNAVHPTREKDGVLPLRRRVNNAAYAAMRKRMTEEK